MTPAKSGNPETTTGGPLEPSRSIASAAAADALAALATSAETCDLVFRSVKDPDLSKPAELHAGELPNSVEGIMLLTAWDPNNHAEQIEKA